jgi:hypothetical protein
VSLEIRIGDAGDTGRAELTVEKPRCDDVVLRLNLFEASTLQLEPTAKLNDQGLIMTDDVHQHHLLLIEVFHCVFVLIFRTLIS